MDKKVLMVLDSYYPSDLRVRKEAEALLKAGFKLYLLCYRRSGEEREEVVGGINVIRTDEVISNSKKGLIDIWNSLTFINRMLYRALSKLDIEFDLMHVHDLPPAQTALLFAQKRGIPAILDLHENYPAGIATWFEWRKSKFIRIKNKLFFNPQVWQKRERDMVWSFDKIIAVVDEMKERLIAEHQLSGEKITVVPNSEPSNLFEKRTLRTNRERGETLVYVGGIGPHRGLDTAIMGVKLLVEMGHPHPLKIVGSGNPDNVNHLKKLVASLGVDKWVEFTGQLPYEEAIDQMQGAFLNIIPHHSNPQNDNGTPHKIFQILNSGYPLLVSSSKPLKRLVETYEAGLVFEAGDPKSFAEVVIKAEEMPHELEQMAKNGREATISGGLNWETDAQVLINLYSNI